MGWENSISGLLPFFLVIGIPLLIGLCVYYNHDPYQYPYDDIQIDITGRRNPKREDILDEYLNIHGITEFLSHYQYVQQWKMETEDQAKKALFAKHRLEQFHGILDDSGMFRFKLFRVHTRYRQVNYRKIPYQVRDIEQSFSLDLTYIRYRYNLLKEIDFETTMSKYHAKNQRKLMTPALRKQIMVRDNYTCQKCGKYMPDEVGLHIDHIIPVSKGGKTVSSNLQVLCSRCNGQKSNK